MLRKSDNDETGKLFRVGYIGGFIKMKRIDIKLDTCYHPPLHKF